MTTTETEITQPVDTPEATETPTAEVPQPTDGAANDATSEATDAPEADLFAQLDEQPVRGRAASSRTGNSQWAPESVRNDIARAMRNLTARGFTRPSLIKATGMTDSQLWRAQNAKVHQHEVPAILDLIKRVVDGDLTPPASRRKLTVEDLQEQLTQQQEDAARALNEVTTTFNARIQDVLETLAFDAKTTAQYRKVVEAAQETLRELVARPTDEPTSA